MFKARRCKPGGPFHLHVSFLRRRTNLTGGYCGGVVVPLLLSDPVAPVPVPVVPLVEPVVGVSPDVSGVIVPVVSVVPIVPVVPMVPVLSVVVPVPSVAGIWVVVLVVSSAAVSPGSGELQPLTSASGAAANSMSFFMAILLVRGIGQLSHFGFVPEKNAQRR
jgi:hypothetical protein